MKKKIIITVIVLGIVILGVVGLWAYKTGKLAGWADIVSPTATPLPSVGVLVNVKDGSTPVAGAIVHVCPHTVADPSAPNCQIGSAMNGVTNSNGQYDLSATSPICTNDPRPYSYLSFYVSKTGYNTTSYQSVSIDTYCSQRTTLYFNLAKGTIIAPPPPPVPPATDKVDLTITVGDKSDHQKAISGIPVVIDGTNRATTDTNGYATLKGIDAGNHKLEINPYGDASCNTKYTQVIVPAFVVKNQIINPAGGIGRQVAHFDLDLRNQNETFILQGKITGPDGSLLEGAKIEVVCALCGMGPWQTTSTSQQYGYGNYQIKNIYNINRTGINDSIFARITKDGYIYDPNNDGQMDSIIIPKTEIVWKFDHFEANKDFQLKLAPIPTITLRGRIIDKISRDALEGVEVKIAGHTEKSGKLGIYVIENIPYQSGGSYRISISKSGYQTIEKTIILKPDDHSVARESFELVPAKGNYVYGLVVDENDVPLEGVKVSVIKDDQLTDKIGTTNNEGYYFIDNVPEGPAVIRVFKLNFSDDISSRKETTIKKIEPTEVNFKLHSLGASPNEKIFCLTISLIDQKTGRKLTWNDLKNLSIDFNIKSRNIDTEYLQYWGEWTYNDIYELNLWGPEDGTFIICLPAGTIQAGIWIDGYENKKITFRHRTSDDENISISLVPYEKGSIQGVVYLWGYNCREEFLRNIFQNRGIQGLLGSWTITPSEITVDLYDQSGRRIKTVTTDEYGSFLFNGLESGKYQIRAYNESYRGVKDVTITGDNDLEKVLIKLGKKDDGQPEITQTKIINGVTIKFVGYGAHKYITTLDWDKITSELKSVRNRINPSMNFPTIYVVESGYSNAFGGVLPIECGGGEGFTVLLTSVIDELGSKGTLPVLLHEFAHYYDYKYLRETNKIRFLTQAYEAADSMPGSPRDKCPFDRIRDVNVEFLFHEIGHPWDNKSEFLASFFFAFYYHHDYLHGIIKYHTNGECQNVLAYMWEFFSQEIGSVNSNDKDMFPPKGGKLRIISPDNIKNGSWREDLAREQSLTERTLTEIRATANNIMASPTVKAAPVALQRISSSLSHLLFWQKRGNIEVTINESVDGRHTPVKGAIVNIGGFCTTDKNGKCSINNIRVGEKKIKIYDGTTLNSFEISTEDKASIEPDKTIQRTYVIR